MSQINVVDVITQIRERVHDRDSRAFTEDEILRVMDNRLRYLSQQLRVQGEYHGLDSVDVAISTLTAVEPGVFSYSPPEWIGDVQLVELISAQGSVPVQVPRGTLEEKDIWRSRVSGSSVAWIWASRGHLHLRGSVINYATMRIWFIREIPPLFYFQAASGTAGGCVVGTATGGYKKRDGLYDGSKFECTSDSGAPSNVGQVRMCSTFLSTGNMAFSSAWPGTLSVTSSLAMIVPLPPENLEFFMSLCSLELFRRSGSPEEIETASQEVSYLQNQFESGIGRRSTGEPPRLFSSRRHGR